MMKLKSVTITEDGSTLTLTGKDDMNACRAKFGNRCCQWENGIPAGQMLRYISEILDSYPKGR